MEISSPPRSADLDIEAENNVEAVAEPSSNKARHAKMDSFYRRHEVAIKGIAFSLAVFVVSRIIALGSMFSGIFLIPGRDLRGAMLAWDSAWYWNLIKDGYPQLAFGPGAEPQNTVAFFPLYPLAARFLDDNLGMSAFQAGLTVALLSTAAAAVALWFLANKLTNPRTANLAVTLFVLSPASVASLMLMSEGVLLLFAILCVTFLLNKKWLIAGLCAALATAARPNGLVLVACCGWAALMAIKESRDWRSLIAPVIAPAGIIGYFLFLWHHTGSFFAWWRVEQDGWGYGEYSPLGNLTVVDAFFNPLVDISRTIAAIALVMAVVGLVLLAYWRPPFILTIVCLGICYLAFGNGGPASKVRYLWTAFPFAIALAYWAKTELRAHVTVALAASSLAIYTLIATHTQLSIL